MTDESKVVAVGLSAAIGALPVSVRVYEPGKLPAVRPAEFVVVTIVRRAGGSARAARYSTTGWALYFMAASKESVANARNSLRLLNAAFENKVLTVDAVKSTPVKFDNARPVAEDDGWFTGVNTYNFTL